MQQLRQLATTFRGAIEESKDEFPDSLKRKFESFPKDVCFHASALLAEYFLEKGVPDVYFVVNGRLDGDPEKSHAWIEIGTVIVDITASQFPDIFENVMIKENRTFHERFWGQQSQAAISDFGNYVPEARENFRKAYAKIRGRLP